MEGKSRYVRSPEDGEGLRDSQGNLEAPETIHHRLFGLSLEPKKESSEFPHSFHPQLNENSELKVQEIRQRDNPEGEQQKERWRELFEYGTMKQKQRKELAE